MLEMSRLASGAVKGRFTEMSGVAPEVRMPSPSACCLLRAKACVRAGSMVVEARVDLVPDMSSWFLLAGK
jgi:hypothetical protein